MAGTFTDVGALIDKIVAILGVLSSKFDGIFISPNDVPILEKTLSTLQQVSDDLDAIQQSTTAYIAARDAIDVKKDADLAAALAQIGNIPPAVQDQIDAVFAKAEADKALLVTPAVTPAVTPT
jgi:hypothetical protein